MSDAIEYKIACEPFGYVKSATAFTITFDAINGVKFGNEESAKIACRLFNNIYGILKNSFVVEQV